MRREYHPEKFMSSVERTKKLKTSVSGVLCIWGIYIRRAGAGRKTTTPMVPAASSSSSQFPSGSVQFGAAHHCVNHLCLPHPSHTIRLSRPTHPFDGLPPAPAQVELVANLVPQPVVEPEDPHLTITVLRFDRAVREHSRSRDDEGERDDLRDRLLEGVLPVTQVTTEF